MYVSLGTNYLIYFIYPVCHRTGNSENKRLRKPTKRLLESTEEYEQIFIPKKISKKNTAEPSRMVRCSSFGFLTIHMGVHSKSSFKYLVSFIYLFPTASILKNMVQVISLRFILERLNAEFNIFKNIWARNVEENFIF